ncbi:MAG: Cupin domain protein [Aeromicrobium sp.]|nr:Cupin domain protein [Aeromicrobium sp.]
MWLLLDSSDTGGAVSTHRVLLRDGAEGAAPHRHFTYAEIFYVLSGAVDVLVGEEVLQLIEGDLVVVPAGVDHAFGATADADGDLLVAVTPGAERFDFFRAVHAVITGKADPSVLAGSEEEYDIHPASSTALEAWQASRPSTSHPEQGDQS